MSLKRTLVVSVGILALSHLAHPAAAQTFISAWGAVGPLCVAIGGSGNLYVSDEGDHTVKVFTNSGAPLGQWPVPHGGLYASPANIAVDSNDNVYVDTRMGTLAVDLLKFTSAGTLVTQVAHSSDGMPVAVDGSGNLYVADKPNRRVQVFTSSGAPLREFPTPFPPDGMAVDADGSVYVTDPFHGLVSKFASNGALITQWGGGAADGRFYPARVAIGPDGHVFVSDFENHRVQVFTSIGGFVAMWGTVGTANGQFAYPLGIAVDSNGYIYVVDKNNTRIQKFGFTPTAVAGVTWGGLKTRYQIAGQARQANR